MKIDEKLRIVYDWVHGFPQFEGCGKRFDGKEEGVLCFTAAYAKTINWKEIQKIYNDHQKEMDDYIAKIKKLRKLEDKCQ